MARTDEFRLLSGDGKTRLLVRRWIPEAGPPRGVVQLAHGIAEHSGRYHDFACFLADHGFCVAADDHLGHGRSASGPEELGYTAPSGGWNLMAEDLFLLHRRLAELYPGLPQVLLGHSMGSFLARTFLIRHPGAVDGCILSGTGQNPPALVAVGRLIARLERARLGDHGRSSLIQRLCFGAYNGQFRPTRTHNDWISRDEAAVDAYCADPFCQFWPTVTLFGDMMEGLQFIADPRQLARMDPATPILFFSGDRDPVGDRGRGVRKAYQSFLEAGCRDVTLRLYPGGRHEMLNEINRAEVYEDVLAWLLSHLSASSIS